MARLPNPGLLPTTFLFVAAVLSGCTTTGIIVSENPSKERPPAWGDYWSLPVEVHGSTPGASQQALASMFAANVGSGNSSGRRVVLYLNGAQLPPDTGLCGRPIVFRPGEQSGRYASLTGALCRGDAVVTFATARILAAGITPEQVGGHLEMMHLQLFQALTYGNNHPDIRFPSHMYGT